MSTRALAERLVSMYAEAREADGRSSRLAWARFKGATEAASVLGYGMTETELHFILQDAWKQEGSRPPATAMNKERKEWQGLMVTYVHRALLEVMTD